MAAIISFDEVDFKYGDNYILKKFSFSIDENEKVAIIGSSGSGKSTILKLILGFEKPSSGCIKLFGHDIHRGNDEQTLALLKNIGILFQSAALFDFLTVKENVLFALRNEKNQLPERAMQELDRVVNDLELEAHLDKLPSELSGGQKKRVGLARAIIRKPKIMLYDEPTTGLDPVLSTVIENCINHMNAIHKVASIVVSHQPSTILRTADSIHLLGGKAIQESIQTQHLDQQENSRIRNFVQGVSQ